MRRVSIASALLVSLGSAIAAPPPGATNLVTNAGFESGVTGFSSDYTHQAVSNGSAGEYDVVQHAAAWNGDWVGSARTGSGMFIANGATDTTQAVWQQTVTGIQANTEYFFEAWVMNACCNFNTPNSSASLSFYAGNTLLGTRTADVGTWASGAWSGAGVWQGLSTTWNSGGTSGSVVLRLVNSQSAWGGNDFAVDDINLSTISTVPSAVPEPSAYMMALLALGAMGVAARRRRQKSA
jgi:PEP-CTERM motif